MKIPRPAILLLVGTVLSASGCSDRPEVLPDSSAMQAYKRLRVAVVEPATASERFNAGIIEDMTRIFVTHFGTVTIAKSAGEARASNPDLIAFLSVDSDLSTHIFSSARIDVHVRFSPPDNRVLEELHAHGGQYPRPFLLPNEVNEAARERAREQMHAALLGSAKLAGFAKAPRSTARKGATTGSALTFHSDIDAPVYKLRENPDNYALVIGIEQYADLPDAQFAARDADTVRSHLVALGYPARNVVHLTGQSATRAGIQKYLSEWLPRNVKPESTVFFYYSGHGAPDPKTGQAYLVPWDGDPSFLGTTAYPLDEVYASLGELRVKEVIVVLDSCFSGAGGRSVLAKGVRPMVITVDPGFLPRDKIVLFTAASREEITGGLDDQGHGIFTYYFLKGLSGAAKNKAGAVTLKGLYEYVKPLVQDAARRQNRDQTPVLFGPEQDRSLIRLE